jgi:PEGA domain-containing protein
VAKAPAQPVATLSAPQSLPPEVPATSPAEPQASESAPAETPVAEPGPGTRARKAKRATPEVILGQLTIDSTPQGAQVQLDGSGDASWVTPLALTNIQPGPHSIVVSKAGYSTDTRSINVASGSRATTLIHLARLMATLVVKSDPSGANIYLDGRDTGTKTPGQVSVDKGQHVVLVRMSGYIDETMNAQFVLGQTFNFSPMLRRLGNTDNLKTVGKMSKLFGGKAQAGQGILSIRTQPKGAQIAINQHLLEKGSPVDVALDPGNYEVDITLSGYAPVHKIINTEKGGKVVIDEVMQSQ